VAAVELAREMGVSLRTIYRDVETLVGQGAPIEGEAGMGYVLKPGFILPPLMFGEEEVDALILGLRLVAQRGDPSLERAAADALAKITAVLPQDLADAAAVSGLLAGPTSSGAAPHMATVRQAMHDECKLELHYTDKRGTPSTRTVWPVAIGFFEAVDVLVAWCEVRDGFRHFRLDRITSAIPRAERMPKRRRILLADWRALEGLDGD
jgi:predicted DNA-binding transcriptional regulator YafY